MPDNYMGMNLLYEKTRSYNFASEVSLIHSRISRFHHFHHFGENIDCVF